MQHPLRTKDAINKIVSAIESAELNTSGEIRVHVESKCTGDSLSRALYIFKKLKMYKTEQRNAILIYVAYDSHKLAIIGDEGINSKVGDSYWGNIKEDMITSFLDDNYVGGVCNAVTKIGDSLKQFFPYKSNDVNEQSNEVSFGD